MKKLTLYTLKEAIGPFLAALLFFTFIFVIQLLPGLFKTIIQNGAPVNLALEIFVYMMPFNMAITVPMSVLMAGIMSIGRLSGDNEVVAMRALGFSQIRVYKPVIIFGVLSFIASTVFNNFVMSETNYRYMGLMTYIANVRPSVAVNELEFNNIPDMNLTIGAEKVTSTNMQNVVIYDRGSGVNQTKKIITARLGEWQNNIANSRLIRLRLYDGILQEFYRDTNITNDFTMFEAMDINISRNVADTIGGHERSLREVPVWEIGKRINDIRVREKIETSNQILGMISNEYTNQLMLVESESQNSVALAQLPDFETFSKNYSEENIEVIENIKKENAKNAVPYFYSVDFHKFLSLPLACFFLAIIAAPLGMIKKRSGKSFSFGIGILIAVLYYFLVTAAELVSGTRRFPAFVAMWLPNTVLFIIAAIFMLRAIFSRK